MRGPDAVAPGEVGRQGGDRQADVLAVARRGSSSGWSSSSSAIVAVTVFSLPSRMILSSTLVPGWMSAIFIRRSL